MTDKQIIDDKKYCILENDNIGLCVCKHRPCEQLKRAEQKLAKIKEYRHNYCMDCEDLLKPSHSCKGCNMVELKHLIEGKENE